MNPERALGLLLMVGLVVIVLLVAFDLGRKANLW